jgi:2-polyprenyl-3-methyl-5-hydroxy-6-metoxy-1,4-benzoquinol methylase
MATAAANPPTERLNAEALFDSVGPAYEEAFATCTPQQASVNWLLSQLPANGSVLDVGCGTGRPVCSSLADAGHSVLGIDVSGAMIAAAKQNVPEASFEKVDFKSFSPSPEGKQYDAITVYFSMIASVSQQEIKDNIAKCFTWVKPGGHFVFATVPISGENLEINWMGRAIIASSLGPEEVVEAIKAPGFEVVEQHLSTFFPKAVEAGICEKEEIWEEPHIFVYAKKP